MLKNIKHFPLNNAALLDFDNLKEAIAKATLQAIDDGQRFVVECDASEVAISATLNQGGRPVAFFSRTLSKCEMHYPAVEKEAMCIIESVKNWSHLLIRQTFTLITDQRSVAFMLDNRKRTKIKNNKILCWRLEMAPFSYDIKYRPGKLNTGPDTLTRAFCASVSSSNLNEIHKGLCCPGITRLFHFVKQKNLPYSLADVKRVCENCPTCAELKPQFFSPPFGKLIKATQPMERLNIDFKGPLPSSTRNKYFLCIIDEYSRFPFCYPCADMSTSTIIKCLDNLFYTYGVCSYVHSDRWSSFKSEELKNYFLKKGVACSMSTPYHPIGNAQVERYNGIVWKSVRCYLKNNNLEVKQWEQVLPQALHSIRSLLCTSTNQTPHERFFNFTRRSTLGMSLPTWLTSPGPVMLRNFVRNSKHDDLVQRVHLTEANPMYARVRFPEGREANVSLRDLAPCPNNDDLPNEGITRDVDTTHKGLDKTRGEGTHGEINPEKDTTPCESSAVPVLEVRREHKQGGGVINTADINAPETDPTPSIKNSAVGSTPGPVFEAEPQTSHHTITPRQSSRSNRGVPPNRFGENTCSFVWDG